MSSLSTSSMGSQSRPRQLSVPFVDLGRQYAQVKNEVESEVLACLERGDYVGGTAVTEFENAFAEYCGAAQCVGVANGTDALRIALEALGAGPGKEVLTVAHTFIATVEAIMHTGATPRFVDVDSVTGTIDPELIGAQITKDTVAVIAVHLYGRPADMDAINAVCSPRNIPVVEDAAQAQGAIYKDRRVGSLGDVACFSFYPSKNLGAAGDAGAVTTNSNELAARVRLLANHGSQIKYVHDVIGHNSRLDTLQALVLSIKLRRLDEWNDARRAAARQYQQALADAEGIRLPAQDNNTFQSVHHLFAIRVANRDGVGLALKHRGIATAVHYPIGVHRQHAFDKQQRWSLPNSEDWADNELSLPMFETINSEQIAAVCDAVRDVAAETAKNYLTRRSVNG